MSKNILIILIIVLGINSLYAQTCKKSGRKMEVTGSVLDVYRSPIVNAIIIVDDQNTNAVTNSRGIYKVRVRRNSSTIKVVTFGNGIFGDSIKGRNRIDFTSREIANNEPVRSDGDMSIYTGYGTIKKKNLTTNISKIDGTKKNYSSYSSIFEMLEREVAGVRISGNEVIIQDSQNFMGYIHPLIVVDGVNMDYIPNIPPVTVKSIEVLKGTAGAIYGSRANGGVIIINTKIQND